MDFLFQGNNFINTLLQPTLGNYKVVSLKVSMKTLVGK
jgi:hypothetical protein